LGSTSVKAARRMLMKLTPDVLQMKRRRRKLDEKMSSDYLASRIDKKELYKLFQQKFKI